MVETVKTLAQRVQDLGADRSQYAVELEGITDALSKHFEDRLNGEHIHIIAQVLPSRCRTFR
jgi:hypothetical protein